jgi:hypothetical protein
MTATDVTATDATEPARRRTQKLTEKPIENHRRSR